jgi:S-adenosylmethionine decarboxylase
VNYPSQLTAIDTAESAQTACRVEVTRCTGQMVDLAPMIVRRRLVIEGTCRWPIVEDQIKRYLKKLSDVCEMTLLVEPVTHQSERYGWAAWVHWENSGAHFYAWDTPKLFFSVDIYTCKDFDIERACEFTKTFFQAPQAVAMVF